jgi:hypothetical protein
MHHVIKVDIDGVIAGVPLLSCLLCGVPLLSCCCYVLHVLWLVRVGGISLELPDEVDYAGCVTSVQRSLRTAYLATCRKAVVTVAC